MIIHYLFSNWCWGIMFLNLDWWYYHSHSIHVLPWKSILSYIVTFVILLLNSVAIYHRIQPFESIQYLSSPFMKQEFNTLSNFSSIFPLELLLLFATLGVTSYLKFIVRNKPTFSGVSNICPYINDEFNFLKSKLSSSILIDDPSSLKRNP